MFRLVYSWIAVVSIGLCVFSVSVHAQNKNSGSIGGTVTLGGKPAKGVPVVASVNTNSPSQKPVFGTATTDEEGRYVITGLASGQYSVAPYQPTSVLPERTMFDTGSKSVTLNDNESAANIDFTLSTGAVITGRVTGSDGRPLIEQRINVESANGKQSFGGIFGGDMYRTDDRGIYRIYGLPAGSYYVSVGEVPNSNVITFGVNTNGSVPHTYYPGVTKKSDAKLLEMTDGSTESAIDISVGAREKTYSVTGRMVDQATGKPVADIPASYGLVQPGGSIGAFGTSTNSDTSGQFKLNSLKPGRYAVFAGGFSFGGNADKWTSDPVVVEIADANVSDVEIKVRAGIAVDGVAVVDGTSDPEILRKLVALRVQVFSFSPPSPGTIQTPSGHSAQVGVDGRFHVDGLQPGRFNVYVSQTGADQIFSLKSIEQDGNTILDGMIDIGQGLDHTNVRLVLETGNGTLRGQMNVIGGELPAGTRISGSLLRPGQSRFQARSFTVDSRGRFLIEHLAAGEYEIQVTAFPAPGQPAPPRPVPSVRQNVTITGSGEVNVTITLDLTPRPGGTPQ
jgi:protocatechuate 3,4-dioxygenase beta subunit